jgi:hypothetical protein
MDETVMVETVMDEPIMVENNIEISVNKASNKIEVSQLSQVVIEDEMYEVIENTDPEIPPMPGNIMPTISNKKNPPDTFKREKYRKLCSCLLSPCFCLACVICYVQIGTNIIKYKIIKCCKR